MHLCSPMETFTFTLELYSQLDSTNAFARRKILKGLATSPERRSKELDLHVIQAQTQTKGRGTRDHTWISEAGNLFLSLILPLERLGLERTSCSEALSLTTGVAVARMVQRLCPQLCVAIKAPNDVLIEGQKVAGILIEIEPPYAIVGIGVDVASAPEAIPGATYLGRYAAVTLEEARKTLLDALAEAYGALRVQGLPSIKATWGQLLRKP